LCLDIPHCGFSGVHIHFCGIDRRPFYGDGVLKRLLIDFGEQFAFVHAVTASFCNLHRPHVGHRCLLVARKDPVKRLDSHRSGCNAPTARRQFQIFLPLPDRSGSIFSGQSPPRYEIRILQRPDLAKNLALERAISCYGRFVTMQLACPNFGIPTVPYRPGKDT